MTKRELQERVSELEALRLGFSVVPVSPVRGGGAPAAMLNASAWRTIPSIVSSHRPDRALTNRL